MKLSLSIPLQQSECNLKCDYCYSREHIEDIEGSQWKTVDVTFDQIQEWERTALPVGTDVAIALYGGECSIPVNREYVLNILSKINKEKIIIETNGLGESGWYDELSQFQHKIMYSCFTFQRKTIKEKMGEFFEMFQNRFIQNAKLVRDQGGSFRICEIWFPEYAEEILATRDFWRSEGVDFKLSPLYWRKDYTAREFTEGEKALFDKEYLHGHDHGVKERVNIIVKPTGHVVQGWEKQELCGHILDGTFTGKEIYHGRE